MTSDKITASAGLPELLTVQEVADIFRVSKLTIKRWGTRGILNPIRINNRGDRRYLRQDIEEVATPKPVR